MKKLLIIIVITCICVSCTKPVKEHREEIQVVQSEDYVYYTESTDEADTVVDDTPDSINDSKASEDELMWIAINTALYNGEYNIVVDLIEGINSPNDEHIAMYNLAQYNMFGQDGDDIKSQEYFDKIPLDYNGRNADLISYWQYRISNGLITLDDYVNDIYEVEAAETNLFYLFDPDDTPLTEEPKIIAKKPIVIQEKTRIREEDISIHGEYKPVNQMTQEEIQAELVEILEGALGW